MNPNYIEKEELEFSYNVFVPNQEKTLIADGKESHILENKTEKSPSESDLKEAVFDPENNYIDKIDCLVAAGSAVLCSALDILWVKEFSLAEAQSWGKEKADDLVMYFAKKKGYKGDSLKGAIKKLEEEYPFAADQLKDKFGGGNQHHLRDFSHHASIFGLCCSILTQFTKYCFGTDTEGNFIYEKLSTDENIGRDIGEKIYFGIIKWAMHLISDIDGSSNKNAKWGTGIPGPILSFLKEVATIINEVQNTQLFNELKSSNNSSNFSIIVSKLFNGTFFEHENRDSSIRFDLRTEMGIAYQLGKQAIPVIANEVLVRSFYAIRRFAMAIKNNQIKSIRELKNLDPKQFLPFNNRTVIRMITISSGSFMVITTAEAAVKAAIKNQGDIKNIRFVKDIFVGINYAGVARFVFACKTDAKYISEDMKAAIAEFKEKHKNSNQSIVEEVPGIELLLLSENQVRLLASFERQKVLYDIKSTKSEAQKEKKRQWLDMWINSISSIETKEYLIKEEKEIVALFEEELKSKKGSDWVSLIALELGLFQPYKENFSNDKKKYSNLKVSSKYEEDVFCSIQSAITKEDYVKLIKTHKSSMNEINNLKTKVIVATAVSLAVTAATAGVAIYFAPGIAIAIAGESVAGLSGAALTSASLAFVGGGSLAVGGMGMAGGTAIIAGGGALLGLVGSSATTFATVNAQISKEKILQDCARLMTVSKSVLIDMHKDYETVKSYSNIVKSGVESFEKEIKRLEEQMELKKKDEKKELKKKNKDTQASLKYIERCYKYLEKISKEGQ